MERLTSMVALGSLAIEVMIVVRVLWNLRDNNAPASEDEMSSRSGNKKASDA
jgi:hypothetical protein